MGRFIEIQPLLLPQAGVCTEDQMYLRSNHPCSVGYAGLNEVCIKKWDVISFDTYFNSFSLAKWRKYTCLDSLWIKLRLKGKFQISLIGYSYRNAAIVSTTLSVQTICVDGLDQMIPFPASDCMVCAFSLQALEDGCVFYSGAYCCDETAAVQNVHLALNICTYHREQYVKNTLSHLCRDALDKPDSPLYEHIQVFITDNGQSLQLGELERECIHLNGQSGYGSAGGFARGQLAILESRERYNLTHMIFMDDDILLDPVVLVRTFWFLSCLKETYSGAILGGELLKRNFPMMQVEAGAQWLDGKVFSTKPNLDLRKFDHVLFNELEEPVNYQGWWYCCVPLGENRGLPLPVYFHRDDVEFGLRYTQFIYLNGIAVWHDEFENKPYSQNEYYDMRNKLIVNAIHCEHYSKSSAKKDVIKATLKKILTYRYKEAFLILNGVEDYCAGVDWVLALDNQVHNEELIEKGYHSVPLSQAGIPFEICEYEKNLFMHTQGSKWYKAIKSLTSWLMPTKGMTTVPMFLPSVGCFYRKKYAQNYDSSSERVYVTSRDYRQCLGVLRALFKMLMQINKTFDSVKKDWRVRYPQLITADYWKEKLQVIEESIR